MEKVKLPREVAKAIEVMADYEYTNFAIICSLQHKDFSDVECVEGAHKVLREYSFGNSGANTDILIKALVNGYEVEFAPEEDIKAEYDAHKNIASSSTSSPFYEGFHRGIRFTLEKLNRLDIIGEVK
jgi:hypothetical protein